MVYLPTTPLITWRKEWHEQKVKEKDIPQIKWHEEWHEQQAKDKETPQTNKREDWLQYVAKIQRIDLSPVKKVNSIAPKVLYSMEPFKTSYTETFSFNEHEKVESKRGKEEVESEKISTSTHNVARFTFTNWTWVENGSQFL